jgi:hypothetical protein
MSIEDQKSQPKKITVDGQTVENRSIDDLRKSETDEDIAASKAAGKLPIKFFKFRFPGSVR